ncbi:MAG: rhomboid family intramembrane serine protease [Flavobacteriales bacterium]|jgi:membrane associated rhomboid family serine protease|nr:rhomboid family intramembrane serine protease [Flavobacteriales bacterium]MBT6808202.1 rhomboid family intramembrane serine protease [Flavobacteriales bacterium]
MYRPTSFRELPEIIKNLLIINGLLFLATISLESYGIDLTQLLGLHQFQSEDFMPHQLITHFFMHGNFTHLFFNMFALWMFGKILENVWGAKRFLIYYMITALGAAALHLAVSQYQIYELSNEVPNLIELAKKGLYNPSNENSLRLTQLVTTPTVGASGAVFGILLAFGMLFPNTLLYIYFAIPIKAKYFVMIYGALELYLGLSNNPADNVAHFAHLGGMLFGFLLLKYWQKNHTQFY